MRTINYDEASGSVKAEGLSQAQPASARRHSLPGRLSLGGGLFVAVLSLAAGAGAVAVTRAEAHRLAELESRRSLALAGEIMRSELSSALAASLRSAAGKCRDLMAYLDGPGGKPEAEKAVLPAEARRVLLDPAFGKVGESGSYAVCDGSGAWSLFPQAMGEAERGILAQRSRSLSGQSGKEGPFSYEIQPSGSPAKLRKLAWAAYYPRRDLFVWAVAEASEAAALVDRPGLAARLSAVAGVASAGSGAEMLVLDAKGSVLAGKDDFGLASLARFQTGEVEAGGQSFLVDTAAIAGSDWTLVSVLPLEAYDGMTRSLAFTLAALALVSALATAIFLRSALSRRLKPVRAMQAVADRVGSGDLTGRIEAGSDDEIGDVAGFFNDVMDEFSSVLQKMRSVISVLGESIQNLSTSTQEIASTSNEQAASVKEVLSTMEDSDRLSKGVEVKIKEVAKIANHTRTDVEEGFALIKTSLGKMEEIRSSNSETLAGIKTLGDLIETIWEIVNIINGIADQTKIIAFNAELEAAAAGDAGKNFRIVAGEIRRLADSTVDSTNEIKSKINEIQHASDKLILASETGTQRIREGWEVSTNIRGVFEEVLRSSEISATSANEISRSINMQVLSFEQIFLTLKQISESIDNFVDSTTYTTEVSEKLKSISESFKAQVEAYALAEAERSMTGGL